MKSRGSLCFRQLAIYVSPSDWGLICHFVSGTTLRTSSQDDRVLLEDAPPIPDEADTSKSVIADGIKPPGFEMSYYFNDPVGPPGEGCQQSIYFNATRVRKEMHNTELCKGKLARLRGAPVIVGKGIESENYLIWQTS